MLCTGEAANFACPFPRGSFDQGNPPEFCCVGGGGGSSGRSPFQADDVLHEMRTQPNPKIITWRPVLAVMLSENADHPGRETSMPILTSTV